MEIHVIILLYKDKLYSKLSPRYALTNMRSLTEQHKTSNKYKLYNFFYRYALTNMRSLTEQPTTSDEISKHDDLYNLFLINIYNCIFDVCHFN